MTADTISRMKLVRRIANAMISVNPAEDMWKNIDEVSASSPSVAQMYIRYATAVVDALELDSSSLIPLQLGDPQEYQKVYQQTTGTHPCEVEGCRLSQEEHHRLAYGLLTQLKKFQQERNQPHG